MTEPELRELDLGVLIDATYEVLEGLATLQAAPTGEIPLATVMNKAAAAEESAKVALNAIGDLEREYLADQRSDETGRRRRNSPYTRLEGDVYWLQSALRSARILISEADKFANSRLLILRGEAGTGKTHPFVRLRQQPGRSGGTGHPALGSPFHRNRGTVDSGASAD